MKRIIHAALFLALSFQSLAQDTNIEEDVYVHLSSHQLLVGETLEFSLFANSKKTNKPSPLSQLAYVELFNAQGKAIFQHKIVLKNGRGHGQYFVNSTLSTGSYRLICSTRWMRNFNTRFEAVVLIVNPFEKPISENDTSASSDKSIAFRVNNQQIIEEIPNQIFYQLTGALSHTIKGKLIDPQGRQVLEFTPLDLGIGSFDFTPKPKASYKIIMETPDGKFHFSEIKANTNTGESLIIHELDNHFSITVYSIEKNFSGRVRISRQEEVFSEYDVINGSRLTPSKNNLGPGLFTVSLKDGNGKLCTKQQLYIKEPEQSMSVKSSFAQRSPVQMDFDLEAGTYVIAVKKKREWVDLITLNPKRYVYMVKDLAQPEWFLSNVTSKQLTTSFVQAMVGFRGQDKVDAKQPIIFAPEHKGELVSGKVKQDARGNLSTLLLSIYGKNQLAIADTDSLGHFSFTIPSLTANTWSFIQTVDGRPISIDMDSPFLDQIDSAHSKPFVLSNPLIAEIASTSVRNQIENAYYEVKQDSSRHAIDPYETFHTLDEVYLLDDYNRFSTMTETIVEIIPTLTVTHQKDGKGIKVRFGSGVQQSSAPPLILLDGVVISAAEALAVKTNGIESIGLITQKVFLGKTHYNGVVFMKTYDQAIDQLNFSASHRVKTLITAPEKKIAYRNYAPINDPHIPDFRELLFWDPEYDVARSGQKLIRFYTSDITGLFEVTVSGFTQEGKPVHQVKHIKVKGREVP